MIFNGPRACKILKNPRGPNGFSKGWPFLSQPNAAGSSVHPGQSLTLATVIGNYSFPGEEYDQYYEGVTELQRLLGERMVQQILEQKHQLTPELVNRSCRRVSPEPAAVSTLVTSCDPSLY